MTGGMRGRILPRMRTSARPMHILCLFSLITLSAIGCEPPPVEIVAEAWLGQESGRRIRAVRYVSEDGAVEHAGWWDAKRGHPCAFTDELFPGAGLLCAPPWAPFDPAHTLFTDPACTVGDAYHFAASSGGSPTHAVLDPATGGVHARGAPVPAWHLVGGSCVSYLGGDAALVGPQVLPADFVSAVVDVE